MWSRKTVIITLPKASRFFPGQQRDMAPLEGIRAQCQTCDLRHSSPLLKKPCHISECPDEELWEGVLETDKECVYTESCELPKYYFSPTFLVVPSTANVPEETKYCVHFRWRITGKRRWGTMKTTFMCIPLHVLLVRALNNKVTFK